MPPGPRTNDHGQLPAANSAIRGRVEDEATLAVAQSRSVAAFSASLESIRQRQQQQVVNDRYASAMAAIQMYDAAMLHYQRREHLKEAGDATVDPADDGKWDRALKDAHDRANVALHEYVGILREHRGFQGQLFAPHKPAQAPPPPVAAAAPALASTDQGDPSPRATVTFELEEAAVMDGLNDKDPSQQRASFTGGEIRGSGGNHGASNGVVFFWADICPVCDYGASAIRSKQECGARAWHVSGSNRLDIYSHDADPTLPHASPAHPQPRTFIPMGCATEAAQARHHASPRGCGRAHVAHRQGPARHASLSASARSHAARGRAFIARNAQA